MIWYKTIHRNFYVIKTPLNETMSFIQPITNLIVKEEKIKKLENGVTGLPKQKINNSYILTT